MDFFNGVGIVVVMISLLVNIGQIIHIVVEKLMDDGKGK